MSNISRSFKISLLFFFIFLLLSSIPVRASDFALVPSHPDPRDRSSFTMIQKKLKKEDTLIGDFSIVNLTNTKLSFKIYTDDKNSLLKISSEKISVEAKERVKVSYQIKIPSALKDGEYLINVYAQNTSSEETSSALVFDLFIGDNLRAQPKLIDSSIRTDRNKLTINYKIKNSGNKRIDSLGLSLKLINNLKPVSYIAKTYNYHWGENINILPGEEKDFTHQIESNILASNYKAQFTVKTENYTETKELFLTAIHLSGLLRLIIYIIAFLVLLSFIIFTLFKMSIRAKLSLFISKLEFKKTDISKFSFSNEASHLASRGGLPLQSRRERNPWDKNSPASKDPLEGLTKQIIEEQSSLIESKNLSYEKIFFEVRKIVRQEIELWKEMEKFRNNLKNDTNKEEEIRKRLKESMF